MILTNFIPRAVKVSLNWCKLLNTFIIKSINILRGITFRNLGFFNYFHTMRNLWNEFSHWFEPFLSILSTVLMRS